MIHPCSDDELEKVRVSLNDMKARLHLSLPDKSNESMYGEGQTLRVASIHLI